MKPSIALAICLLASAVTLSEGHAQQQSIKLNAGLVAYINAVGRDNDNGKMTVALTIENQGDSIVHLLLAGRFPQAVDNTGGVYEFDSVSGIARCPAFGPGYTERCLESRDSSSTIPLSSYTQIDPGVSVSIGFGLDGRGSNGPLASFSATFAYRAVQDTLHDATLSEAEKRQELRLMNLSFPPFPVVDAR